MNLPLQHHRIEEITGVILAGGKGTRMNGKDKGLVLLNGKPLYQHVLSRLQPQVTRVIISANRHSERYRESGCEVFSDTFSGFAGPLAGMLTALQHSKTEWAVFTSCDTPFLPHNLVEQLWRGKKGAKVAWVHSVGQDHPTLALMHRSVAPMIAAYLQRGDRKLMFLLKKIGGVTVNFAQDEAFININTLEDLAIHQARR